jgi:hypothetical protein
MLPDRASDSEGQATQTEPILASVGHLFNMSELGHSWFNSLSEIS